MQKVVCVNSRLVTFLVTIFLGIVSSSFGQVKKLIDLTELQNDEDCIVKHTTLQSPANFLFQSQVEVFSVFWKKQNDFQPFMTITLFPTEENNGIQWSKTQNHEQISHKLTKQELLNQLIHRCLKTDELIIKGIRQNDWLYDKDYSKSESFQILVQKDGKLMISNSPLLVEFYLIKEQPELFPGTESIAIINKLSAVYTQLNYQIDISREDGKLAAFYSAGGKTYLEKRTTDKRDTTYTYWSIPPMIYPDNSFNNGIGRMIFSSKKGVLGGEYSYYFDPWIKRILAKKGFSEIEIDLVLTNLKYLFISGN